MLFSRLGVILITLAVAGPISDQSNLEVHSSAENRQLYETGLNLFNQGCGSFKDGLVSNRAQCVLGVDRLQKALQRNPSLVEAHLRLAELYLHQPAQLDWGDNPVATRDKNLKLGYQHVKKALEYHKNHSHGRKLMKLYRSSYESSQTAGRDPANNGTL